MPFTENTLNDKVEKLEAVEQQHRINFEKSRRVLRALQHIQLGIRSEQVAATEDKGSYTQNIRDVKPIDSITGNEISDTRRDEIYTDCINDANELIGEDDDADDTDETE